MTAAARQATIVVGAEASTDPLLKWTGGKTHLLGEIMRRLPPKWHFPGGTGRYWEPFAGGAALFFHLAPAEATLADINGDLIACYRSVAADPEGVIRRLRRVERIFESHVGGRAYYLTVRRGWNENEGHDPAGRAAKMMFLNRTCYNGLWRVNKRGHFNVPPGRYTNPTICDPDRIRAAARLLQRATLCHQSYTHSMEGAQAGDLVYIDPPYVPLTATARFTSYSPDGFCLADHEQLAAIVADLARRGVAVVASNADTPLVRRLYREVPLVRFHRVSRPGSISSRGSGRQRVRELLITAGYTPPATRR